jgi:beta-phosphoglucomutase-like phosphatase (HAD superfamily)
VARSRQLALVRAWCAALPMTAMPSSVTGRPRPSGIMLSMIEAVVFDLDGVLVDSEPVWEQVRREVVAEHGGHWDADTQDRLMGMSTAEWSRYLSSGLGVRLSPPDVAGVVIEANGLRAAAAAGLAVIAVPHPKYPPAPDAIKAARLVLPSLDGLTADNVAALDAA